MICTFSRVVPFSLILIITLGSSLNGSAQRIFEHWLKKDESGKVQPYLMIQAWSVYSMQQELYDADSGAYQAVANRFNVLLRRARFGLKAQPYDRLKTNLAIAYDLLGRDVLSSLVGGTNNGSSPSLRVWDAYVQWKAAAGSEAAYLTVGYFRPQYSRESITSGWQVGSMEKAMSQSYLRRQLVGTNPGRAVGINLGGLFRHENQKKIALHYNLGVFNPLYHANSGNSVGSPAGPLLVGRLGLSLGDAEQDRYKISYQTNYFNARKGITLSLNGAWQGPTALFQQSTGIGADILLNWGPLNLDTEWHHLYRQGDSAGRWIEAAAQTGHFRVGVNTILADKAFLEPVFMVMHFQGALDQPAQEDAAALQLSSGTETTFDAGLNWYIDQSNLKLTLHYTWHYGHAGDAGDGATVNSYFTQSGLGAIRRGNWIGLGLNGIF